MTNDMGALLQALRLRLNEPDYKAAIPLVRQLHKAISLEYRLYMGGDLVPCHQCRKDFIRGSEGVLQFYCSSECRQAANSAVVHAAVEERRVGRTCAHCSEAIPVEMNNRSKYCSRRCRDAAAWVRTKQAR